MHCVCGYMTVWSESFGQFSLGKINKERNCQFNEILFVNKVTDAEVTNKYSKLIKKITTMETEKLETFINDHLREDLKVYENHLNHINSEIMEYNQLRHTASTINTHLKSGFKTKVDIGANFFVQAKVDDTDRILVNVGLNHFVEFQLEEAIKFCDFKVRVLNKEADVIREESLKCRANIKLALMCIGDKNRLNAENSN